MSARMAKQRMSVKAIPDSPGHDELDDYIRYQDEVLDRNALELRGVVEEQEEKLRLLQQDQDRRMQRLYEKRNQMDTLDEELQKLIQKTDERMGERLVVMDNKTDDYMKDLARRNAQWSTRLKEVDKNITHSARAKGNVIWDERLGQKEINRSSPSQRPVQRKKRPPQTQRKPVQQKRPPQYKVQVTQSGRATPQATTTTTTGMTGPAATTMKSTPTRGSGPKSYPCPTCQNSLVYYDKYQRWWCRSCKKWR